MSTTLLALTPAAAAVLAAATVTDTTVRPARLLPRPVHRELDRVLGRIAGAGIWRPEYRAWVFPHDPRPAIAELVAGAQPREDYAWKAESYFRTPPALADEIAAIVLERVAIQTVLEPSAGDGALVAAIHRADHRIQVTAVEVNTARAGFLPRDRCTVHVCRFQEYAAPDPALPHVLFDAIVMNPPFTEPGDPTAWVTHIELALPLLRTGGVLRSVVPASFAFGDRQRIRDLRDSVDRWRNLPDDAFTPSGTSVRTCLIDITRKV